MEGPFLIFVYSKHGFLFCFSITHSVCKLVRSDAYTHAARNDNIKDDNSNFSKSFGGSRHGGQNYSDCECKWDCRSKRWWQGSRGKLLTIPFQNIWHRDIEIEIPIDLMKVYETMCVLSTVSVSRVICGKAIIVKP